MKSIFSKKNRLGDVNSGLILLGVVKFISA